MWWCEFGRTAVKQLMHSWFRVCVSQRRAHTQERLWFPLWGSRPGKKHNMPKSCLRCLSAASIFLNCFSYFCFLYCNRSLHNTRDNTATDHFWTTTTESFRLGVMLNLCWRSSCKVGCSAPCGVPWGPDPHTAAAFGSDLACSASEVRAGMVLHS